MDQTLDRRQLLRGATLLGGCAALTAWIPAWAQALSAGIATPLPTTTGEDITLHIARQKMMIDGRASHAIGINGTVPAPLIRLREGQNVRLQVVNDLDVESSLHWHGLLVPSQFDGVPGISFPGIAPRSSYLYEFPVRQSGTYWYHSHSGFQEQFGLYGPIVIDPSGADPVCSDREHVIVLSDHSQTDPTTILRQMKVEPDYYNRQAQTLSGLLSGKDQHPRDRLRWGGMRLDPTDIADATGQAYAYLANGHGPADNWTALFNPGERVRLRFVNASSMTTFNVRIPGLALSIVQADGQNVRPVETDEFQIGVAETFDAIVAPTDDRAYTIVGESIDRSGLARATLAPRAGMAAVVPLLRPRPLATMKDMAMGAMKMRDFSVAPEVKHGPGVQTLSPMPTNRTGEPGQGLSDVGHRVLVYRDLVALDRNPDVRAPSRSLDIHLTGNMERFMWSFDGVKMSDTMEPIPFTKASGCG